MIPVSASRGRLRAALVTSVLLGGGLSAALAAPARADYVDVDLSVDMPVHSVVAGSAGKPAQVTVRNAGGDTAKNVVVTVDASKVDPGLVTVRPEPHRGCQFSQAVLTCHFATMDGYAKKNLDVMLTPKAGAEPGSAGNVTVTVKSDTHDNYQDNNSATYPMTVTKPGVDLVALADPVRKPLKPGGTQPLMLAIANAGSTPVHGVSFTIDPSNGTDVGIAERYQECHTSQLTVTCVVPNLTIGPDMLQPLTDAKGRSLFHLRAGKHVLGPDKGRGTFSVAPVSGTARSAHAAGDSLASHLAPATRRVRSHTAERDPADNSVEFTYQVSDNPADVRISVPAVHGTLGDVVTVKVTITNQGPGDGRGFFVFADRPSGTTVVGTPKLAVGTHSEPYMCHPHSKDGHDIFCYHDGEFPPAGTKHPVTGVLTFQLKITSAHVGTDGRVTVKDYTHDPNPKNNTAPIRITATSGGSGGSASPTPSGSASAGGTGGSAGGSGSLPVTGTKLGLIAGGGLLLLLAGGAVVLLARRRRRGASA